METVIDIPAEHEANVFGQFDVYAKKIERALHVTLIARGESVKIMGDALKVEKAKKVLDQLVELSKRGNTIQEQNVDYTLALVMEDSEEKFWRSIRYYLPYITGKADQTQNPWAEKICRCNPQTDDRLRTWACRYR